MNAINNQEEAIEREEEESKSSQCSLNHPDLESISQEILQEQNKKLPSQEEPIQSGNRKYIVPQPKLISHHDKYPLQLAR